MPLTLLNGYLYSITVEMEISLAQKAIAEALAGNWSEAVKINLEILKENAEDLESLNRLAKAYSEIGKVKLARETAQKVIDLDPSNTIAKKCLEKWKAAKETSTNGHGTAISNESFLEESGKTKIVQLVNTGDEQIFATIDPGEEVKMSCYSHKVSVTTKDGGYIGRLPDDIAARIRNLIKFGNKYQVLVKSVQPKNINVFIREIERGVNAPDTPSFPTEKIEYVSFTPPELVHKDGPLDNVDEEFEQDTSKSLE